MTTALVVIALVAVVAGLYVWLTRGQPVEVYQPRHAPEPYAPPARSVEVEFVLDTNDWLAEFERIEAQIAQLEANR